MRNQTCSLVFQQCHNPAYNKGSVKKHITLKMKGHSFGSEPLCVCVSVYECHLFFHIQSMETKKSPPLHLLCIGCFFPPSRLSRLAGCVPNHKSSVLQVTRSEYHENQGKPEQPSSLTEIKVKCYSHVCFLFCWYFWVNKWVRHITWRLSG